MASSTSGANYEVTAYDLTTAMLLISYFLYESPVPSSTLNGQLMKFRCPVVMLKVSNLRDAQTEIRETVVDMCCTA